MTVSYDTSASPARRSSPGWWSLLLAAVAQAYLVFLCALAGIALLPGLFGWHGTVVQTGSMQPHIAPGDVVVLSKLPEQDPVPLNAVVQFNSPARDGTGVQILVLHRVTSAHEDGTYTTAGDANPDPDLEPLHREQITGVGRLLVPYIGLPGLWWSAGNYRPLGLWLAGTLLALILVSRARLQDSPDDDDTTDTAGTSGTDDTEDRARSASAPSGVGATENNQAKELAWITSAFKTTAPVPVRGRGVTRRAVFGIAGAAVLTGMAAHPATRSNAAFTARTSTGASFATATSFPPSLGRAKQFALLARLSLHDAPTVSPSTIVSPGIVGTSEGTISGYPTTHLNSPTAKDAMTDARALYQELKAKAATTWPGTSSRNVTTVPAGTIIKPGVYSTADNVVLNGLTLDAGWNSSAVFILRGRTFDAQAGITISLLNGAKANNVYWCADSFIDLRAGTRVPGTWMAVDRVTMADLARLTGRAIVIGNTTNPPSGSISTTTVTVTLPT